MASFVTIFNFTPNGTIRKVLKNNCSSKKKKIFNIFETNANPIVIAHWNYITFLKLLVA